jgi:hypothetical protein
MDALTTYNTSNQSEASQYNDSPRYSTNMLTLYIYSLMLYMICQCNTLSIYTSSLEHYNAFHQVAFHKKTQVVEMFAVCRAHHRFARQRILGDSAEQSM